MENRLGMGLRVESESLLEAITSTQKRNGGLYEDDKAVGVVRSGLK